MKATLIAPPWLFRNKDEAVDRLSQNLGLGYIASYARAKGHTLEIIDALAEGNHILEDTIVGKQCVCKKGLSDTQIIQRIDLSSDFIGISAPFTNTAPIVHSICGRIKQAFPNVPLVMGGVYASTLPEKAIESGADYIVRGEGEIPFVELLNKKDPADIHGLIFRKGGTIIDNGQADPVHDLNQQPFPARDLLPMGQYLNHSPRNQKGLRSVSITTSRGCPFKCRFCSIHPVCGFKWRPRTPDNVIAEIKECMEKYNVNHIEFEDDNLTFNIERAIEIFEKMMSLPKRITWSAHNGVRIDRLNLKLLELFRKLGCIRLNLAIESGNEKMLEIMEKNLSLRKVEEVVKICGKLGIHTSGFLLVGYPGETEESYKETINYFRKLRRIGLSQISPFIVNPYPGTQLYQTCKKEGFLKSDSEEHIYFMDDYVGIVTPDFTEQDVLRWWKLAFDLNYPASRYVKRLKWLKKLLPIKLQDALWRAANRFFSKHGK